MFNNDRACTEPVNVSTTITIVFRQEQQQRSMATPTSVAIAPSILRQHLDPAAPFNHHTKIIPVIINTTTTIPPYHRY
jgi:hypothetical protein